MKHRWEDVHESVAAHDGDSATYLGGTDKADLWLTERDHVLVCQYEYPGDYVSYYPARAIYARINGHKNDNTGNGFRLDAYPPGARVWWTGSEESEDRHDPMGIARYLAVFAPDIFTEEERADLLGGQTNTRGEGYAKTRALRRVPH